MSADRPNSPFAPARLRGNGYALLYRLPRAESARLLGPAYAERFVGGTAAILVADYEESAVGPHRELLFVAGRFSASRGSHYSITRAFASTGEAASACRGWGIEKETATFRVERSNRCETIQVDVGTRTIAALSLRPSRLGVRVATDLVPPARRTVMQLVGSRGYLFAPEGRTTVKSARLLHAASDVEVLPDLSRFEPTAVFKLEGFCVTLPAAEVLDLARTGRAGLLDLAAPASA